MVRDIFMLDCYSFVIDSIKDDEKFDFLLLFGG